MRKSAIDLIFKIAHEKNAFDILEKTLIKTSRKKLRESIIECGILPEMFEHDSSEEKLWAKFSDIILSIALNYLGIDSKVLRARGNSADVFGQTKDYTIIADAKTFRLSRTAKNQKDFKIKALDDWRKEDTFALLVAPLTQFPNKRSQIYEQAIDKNVTLLSYTHLNFLLEHYRNENLTPLWESGNLLKSTFNKNELQDSSKYWYEIDKIVYGLMNKNIDQLRKYKQLEIIKTKTIGGEGILFWQKKIKEFKTLPKKEAIRLLIKAEKIEEKIRTIQKIINAKYEL